MFDQKELLDRAQMMCKKLVKRKHSTWTAFPDIVSCTAVQQGHFTVVTLNGTITTFAKFNPNDIYLRTLKKKNGKSVQILVSKFRTEAGVNRAIHRAVAKLVDSQLN